MGTRSTATVAAEETRVGDLPEGCLAQAIALTSPRDAARCAAVSPSFRAAADSDAVWARFLPPDYHAMLLASSSSSAPCSGPPACSNSKKELYLGLSDNAVRVGDGSMRVWLEKGSGAKCFGLSARRLCLLWEDGEFSWKWTPHPNSRFGEVAQLVAGTSLDIYGRLPASALTPATAYAAYLLFDTAPDGHRGLSYPDQETALAVAGRVASRHAVCLRPDNDAARRFRGASGGGQVGRGAAREPARRDDGWWEVEMGRLRSGEAGAKEADVVASFEVLGWYPKHGLLVEGIDFRPVVPTSDGSESDSLKPPSSG